MNVVPTRTYTGQNGVSGIRIGDAERERAVQSLGEHLRAGRIEVGEYDERLTAAFGARTAGDLIPLFTDLPGGSPVPPSTSEPRWRAPDPTRLRSQRRGFAAMGLPLRFALVLTLIAGAVIGISFISFPPLFLIPLLWFAFGRRLRHRRRGYAGPSLRRYRY